MALKTNEKGIAALAVLLILLVMGVGSVYIYFKYRYKIASETPISQETKDWQTYEFAFAQVSIKYPKNWLIKSVYKGPAEYKYVDFFPLIDGSVIAGDRIISLGAGLPYDIGGVDDESTQSAYPNYTRYTKDFNFTIPALGNKPNAVFEQQQDFTTIKFERKGIEYSFSADMYQVLNEKMDPSEVTSVLTKMAKSVQFVDRKGSCEEPTLEPLTDFPGSLVLSNRHESDKSDPILGYFPKITLENNDSLRQDAKRNPDRFFIVSYSKEGSPFSDSGDFSKTVVPITGSKDPWTKDRTSLLFVNCPELLGSSKYAYIYKIVEGDSPFGVQIYGLSENPSKLWSVNSWNVDLVKKQRGTVYIKMGDKWQEYKADKVYVSY